ncbi:MAG TPA: APC family permease [Terriglobales bacterium]|nr:APC family permease [Terriglobales bacterium]
MSEKKLFVRKATGLVREIGPLTAVIIILCNVMGLGWQKRVFQFTGAAPLPENLWVAGIPPMVMAFLIGGIIIILSVLAFSILIAAMPRSGGGYVVISRLVSPLWAFVGSWFEFLSISWSFGIISVAVFEGIFFIFGPLVGVTAAGVNDVGLFLGGLFLTALFTAIGALGVRLAGYLLQVLFWIPMLLTVYVFYLLATSVANPSALAAGIASFGQTQGVTGLTADMYVKGALAQGMDAANVGNYWAAVSTAMIGAYFAYIGYAASTFVAGEVKEANKSLPKVLLFSSVFIMVVYMAVSSAGAFAAASLGKVTLPNGNTWSFFEAYSYLSYGAGDLAKAGVPAVKAWTTTIAALTGIGLGLSELNWLLFIFGILWVANDIPPFILTASRILFAMAFDRVLPGSLADVNERFHSPVNATVVTGLFALLGCFSESGIVSNGGSWNPGGAAGSFLNSVFSTGVASTDLFDAVFFTLFALSLVMLPLRKTQIYETAPIKWGGKTGVMVIGVVGVIANLVLDYMILTAPQDSYNVGPNMTGDNWFALGFSIALGILGLLMYAYFKYGKKDVDYSTIFAEIPPE